jgi:hypothetical protein
MSESFLAPINGSLAIAHVCLSEAGKIEAVGSIDDIMIGKILSRLTGMPVSVPAV